MAESVSTEFYLQESDFPYLSQLLEEGVIFIPVINVEQDSEDNVIKRLPDLLHRFDSPIPCVIGTYLDAMHGHNLERACSLWAGVFWGDMSKGNDVLLCSPVGRVSAKFILNYIENHASKPFFEDMWKEQLNPGYWVCRMSILKVLP